jgi:hypothetical protein
MLENRKLRAVKTQLGWLVDPAAVKERKERLKLASARQI